MRIMVLGLRGFPDIQGGVETHSVQLYPKLTALGCDIEVLGRSPFLKHAVSTYKNVRIKRLFSPDPKFKGFEALLHTFLGCLYAGFKRPDILHIHAVGPALMTPLARLLGLRVTVTHHGFDYQREKWHPAARFIIQLGERLGMKFANARIAVSQTIKKHVEKAYGITAVNIPNGVTIQPAPEGMSALNTYELEPHRYILMVSRFVPEKRQGDLIEAFEHAGLRGWKLVLVGALKPKDAYIENILERCNNNPDIILTDFLSGDPLTELYHHAGCFVLPSTHEGLPIVILEALSHGIPVIASDIDPNLEIGLPPEYYFPAADIRSLSGKLMAIAQNKREKEEKKRLLSLTAQYSWDAIAERTHLVYRQCLNPNAFAEKTREKRLPSKPIQPYGSKP